MRPQLPFRALLSLGVAFAGIALLAPPASAGGPQSWMSGVGDDANPCNRTTPCKTLALTLSKTDAGGFIGVLDAGNYGPTATISKSMTIDGTGFSAVMSVSGGSNGVVVDAPAGSHVVIRNLDIRAANLAGGVCDGGIGVLVQGGGSVLLDGVSISGFQQGVSVTATNGATADVSLRDVQVNGNCQYGVHAAPDAGRTARVWLDRVSVSSSGVGLSVGTGAEAWVGNSQVSLNTVGVQPAGTGKIHALCGNSVAGNGSDGGFTDSLCASLPIAPPSSAPVQFCTVPKVLKKTEAQAVAALKAASCAAGKVVKRKSAKKNKGKVIAQAVPAGILVKAGTAIKLVVGK